MKNCLPSSPSKAQISQEESGQITRPYVNTWVEG
jgi:hypothetical protein